ncbi:MAG TPA: outer membrane beta-barrel protein [Afipia sp.]
MKRILTAALFGMGVSGHVCAADLPEKSYEKALSATPVQEWSGFYVGANAGYTTSNGKDTNLTVTDTGAYGFSAVLAAGQIPNHVAIRPAGFIGGGQVGYNWQSAAWVYGLEADIQGASAKASYSFATAPPLEPGAFTGSSSLEWLATFRGRLGAIVAPATLVYVTGGLAVGQTKSTLAGNGPTWGPAFAASTTSAPVSTGWTIGAGAEWKMTPAWSVKGEYLYYDLGSSDVTILYRYFGAVSTLTSHFENAGHIARIGLNYKVGN